MIATEKVRAAARAKSEIPTELLEDSRTEQPLNVLDRRWTPVSTDNPIWRGYRKDLRLLKIDCQKKHQKLSACRKCMTIFYPFFPTDFHLHEASPSFKSAMNSIVVDAAVMKSAYSEDVEDTFVYSALVGLAKEAGAYRVDNFGVEQIKLIRIVRGHRSHRNQGHSQIEFCENCDVEECPEHVSHQKFRSESLAAGILKLIQVVHFDHPLQTSWLRPNHHGAGLEGLFQLHRDKVPEFEKELFFRAFLVAFGAHVRDTIQRDSDSHPISHWWTGPTPRRPLVKGDNSPNPALLYFADSSNGNAFTVFNHKGCETLARNLAQSMFQIIEQYYVTGMNKAYLGMVAGHDGIDPLAEYLADIPEDEEAEEVIRPGYRGLVDVDPRVRVSKKKSKCSATMLAKRAPYLSDKELSLLERKRRNNAAYKLRMVAKKAAASMIYSPR